MTLRRWIVLACLPAGFALVGCPGEFFDGVGFDDGFSFREVNTSRTMRIQLDEANPTQRFQTVINVSPPSPDAVVTVSFPRVDGLAVAEITADAFANELPGSWTLVTSGDVLTSFSAGFAEETFRLSIGTNQPPTVLDLEISVSAPSDVDFDGLDDDVALVIGNPTPFIP